VTGDSAPVCCQCVICHHGTSHCEHVVSHMLFVCERQTVRIKVDGEREGEERESDREILECEAKREASDVPSDRTHKQRNISNPREVFVKRGGELKQP